MALVKSQSCTQQAQAPAAEDAWEVHMLRSAELIASPALESLQPHREAHSFHLFRIIRTVQLCTLSVQQVHFRIAKFIELKW